MRPRARSLHALALLVASAGCSLVIDGQLLSVHCSDEGAVGPPACPQGEMCKSGLCVAKPMTAPKLGSPCTTDADCADGDFCLEPADFGGDAPRACSRPCCSSSACDPQTNFVCWASETGGGNFCIQADLLGRFFVGARKAGAACDTGKDCRSGACAGHHCADPCCSDTNCALEAICRLVSTSGTQTWTCAKPPMKKQVNEPCSSDDQCASGLCIYLGDRERCSQPCCSSTICGDLVVAGHLEQLACDDVEHGGALVRACAKVVPESALGVVGSPCMGDEECRSGRCLLDDRGGICTDVCCDDESCGDPSTFVCRPEHRVELPDASWALRCERK
ncbi:MAG TPA: hypothetical protein VHB21_23230 [Minicystis sp.]|nr:hypothetical protein [Minicystis sp.]